MEVMRNIIAIYLVDNNKQSDALARHSKMSLIRRNKQKVSFTCEKQYRPRQSVEDGGRFSLTCDLVHVGKAPKSKSLTRSSRLLEYYENQILFRLCFNDTSYCALCKYVTSSKINITAFSYFIFYEGFPSFYVSHPSGAQIEFTFSTHMYVHTNTLYFCV